MNIFEDNEQFFSNLYLILPIEKSIFLDVGLAKKSSDFVKSKNEFWILYRLLKKELFTMSEPSYLPSKL